MRILTQLSRILVGILFIISGLIKANDTLGFSYKLLEYFEIFHMQFFEPFAVPISMFICIFEIISGVALLLGIYNRLNAWLLLLMIAFFTLLTGYSAITHKVTDCGCFGDAIKLTPMQSFMKDVVLLVLIVIIFFNQQYIQPLFNKVISNIALFVSLLVSTAFTIYTYMFTPVVDFLPYKIGNNIQALTLIPVGAEKGETQMVFVYEKDGVKHEFDMNHIPDDTSYIFVERIDKVIRPPYQPPIHDFKIYDEAGTEYSDSIFYTDSYKLLLVQTHVEDSRKGTGAALAALAKEWLNQHHEFWALTASSHEATAHYVQENALPFHYYTMDATPLKSMVRSNPGIILMKKNVVVKKWGAYNLPRYTTVVKYMK